MPGRGISSKFRYLRALPTVMCRYPALGRGASLFTGVFDNADVLFKIGQAVLGVTRQGPSP